MKKMLLVMTSLGGFTMLFAQRPEPLQGTHPGQAGWTGQTMQIGFPRPSPEVGGLNPADIQKPLADEWRSYSGDLTGKRYSYLEQVNTNTVQNLSLKWTNSYTMGCGPDGGDAVGFGRFAAPVIVGGFGSGEVYTCGPARFGGGALIVDGVIYAASINDVFAIDARDGTPLWHYYWKYRG